MTHLNNSSTKRSEDKFSVLATLTGGEMAADYFMNTVQVIKAADSPLWMKRLTSRRKIRLEQNREVEKTGA